ncbi:DUF397 domain-containing protein [Allorhizocola rhizosphaerae]|uniref:DUF397 domain-containing protein n=1 Tax=Allorhizocola rhizosphaerae TaxID=1872709 RepID=UPI000E3DE228|nr:DUF397 domain-containing protein [Allorhizocola rhizosphaerae]
MTGRVTKSWHKSTRCGESTHCVEVASYDDHVGLRNSNRPQETLTLSIEAFRDLVDRIKRGELDG